MTTGSPASQLLLAWYQANKRDLPWRNTRDPYCIIVSEFMLHQTRVTTAIPYYHRFLKRFPDWATLAHAPLDDVLKLWEGMGYYARARHLHALAQKVHNDYGGHLPDCPTDLRALPGVGEYTVGAVLSMIHARDVAAVDGNGIRVLSRLFNVQQDPSRREGKRQIQQLADSLLPPGRAAEFNQALMDLGSLVCSPRRPRCLVCPLVSLCEANRLGLQATLPITRARRPLPHFEIAAGIVWHEGRILIARRPEVGLLGGLWEFPGGKQQNGESLADCAKREIREELGIEVDVGDTIARVNHAYTHFRITLHFFDCRYVSGVVQAVGCTAWRWVTPAELPNYAFPAANRTVLALLQMPRI